MCDVTKHVPRLLLFNDFDLAEHLSWVRNMHSESNGRAASIVKHNTSWNLGIRSLPDQTPKSSRIKLDETSGARFMRPLSYPHWYFLAFAGDRPANDDAIQGPCQLRWLPLLLFQNRLLGPDLAPWQWRYDTAWEISVCVMAAHGSSFLPDG